VPPFLQAKTGERVKVFEDNAIHVGYGYKVDVEDALNKIHDILENYDEYKAKVGEWRQKNLVNEYRWDIIVKRLVEVINN
jgi:glycosyltransferase involved in cell wall biosynthesis